jgi:hypothetical protein
MKQFEIVVTVRPVKGRPDFPMDMLRYDRLAPYREEDSYSIGREREARTPDDMEIELVRFAPKNWVPTQGRWESFGWNVVDLRSTGRTL